MQTHNLKILPQYFDAVFTGIKNFEIRLNDRNFQVGDTLLLMEYIPETKEYTHRVIRRQVTYITDYAQQENYVVMAIV